MILQQWYDKHKSHGRAGPWRDANVHVYRKFVCPCGEKFMWTKEEEEKEPHLFVINGRI